MTAPPPSVLRFVALIVLPVLVLMAAVAAFLFLAKSKPQVTKRPPQEQTWTVSSTDAVFSDLKPVLKLTNLRRAPGPEGSMDATTPFPRHMVLNFDGP